MLRGRARAAVRRRPSRAQMQAANGGGSSGGGGSESPRGSWPGPGRRSSAFKGVSWSEASVKWRAQCWNGSKVRRHGSQFGCLRTCRRPARQQLLHSQCGN